MYPRGAEQVASVRERLNLPERYLLWVGRLEHPDPGTHIAQLAAAPRDMPLVLVGKTRPWAHELPRVILTGQVPDDDLAAIYTGAHALMMSAEQGGFGLPGVEALACGTPVVAAEGPALREVLGERATFVPAGDMSALIAAAQRASRPAPPARAGPGTTPPERPGRSTRKPRRTRARPAPPPRASCAAARRAAWRSRAPRARSRSMRPRRRVRHAKLPLRARRARRSGGRVRLHALPVRARRSDGRDRS